MMAHPPKKKPSRQKKANVKEAKKILRSEGASLAHLAKTTGTTKGEGKSLFNQAAHKLTIGGVSKSDTKGIVKALSGGPKAGTARTPAKVAKAKQVGRKVRTRAKKNLPI